jgi:O-antigen ligase
VLLLVLLAELSRIWTVNAQVTRRAARSLLASTALGSLLALRLRLEGQLRLVAAASGIALGMTVLVVLIVPEQGVTGYPHPGAWRGWFWHKNSMAQTAGLAVLVFLLLTLVTSRWRPLAVLGLLLSVTSLLASGSRTLWIATGLSGVSVGFLGALQGVSPSRRNAALVAAAAAAGLIGLWAAGHVDPILAVLERDRTLTNRTLIWSHVLEAVRTRPLLGYGFGAFWKEKSEAGEPITSALGGWFPAHAHNGFLDLTLDLGVVGLALFLVPFGVYGVRAIAWGTACRSPLRLWPAAFLLLYGVLNLGESRLLRGPNMMWALYVVAVATLQGGAGPRRCLRGRPPHPGRRPSDARRPEQGQ